MEIYILFGQRKERYPGEYGPEVLAGMSCYDNDGNPDYLLGEKAKADATGEFERTEIVTLTVSYKSIMEILRPTVKLAAEIGRRKEK